MCRILGEMGINKDMAARISTKVPVMSQTIVQSQILASLELRDCEEGADIYDEGEESSVLSEEELVFLECFDLAGIAKYLEDNACSNVVVMCGKGVSKSTGIPKLFEEVLQRHEYGDIKDIFDIGVFRKNPAPFYDIIKEVWPGMHEPTASHYFLRLLHEKGVLLRCYTQNVDSLEMVAGVPSEKVVAVQGNFNRAYVVEDGDAANEYNDERLVDVEELKAALDKGQEGWEALSREKGGLVKPGIVLMGEQLPEAWAQLHRQDLATCDLLVCLGTGLRRRPFNSLLSYAGSAVPRLLINPQPAGLAKDLYMGFEFDQEENRRDVFYQSDSDEGCHALAAALGWSDDLNALIESKGAAEVERVPWADIGVVSESLA